MDLNPNLSKTKFNEFLSTHQHFPDQPESSLFSSFPVTPRVVPVQSNLQSHYPMRQASGSPASMNPHAPSASLHGHNPPRNSSTQHTCHFMRLSREMRFMIYELALDVDEPRRVFINYDQNWRNINMTQGENIQHAAAVTKVEFKRNRVGSEQYHERLSFTLHEFSKNERKTISRSLWPSLLRVSQETRLAGSKIFYRQTPFIAPSDPFSIPEWEARLPNTALSHLSQNTSLVMEHICGEVQQWRCLRNYLYNPLRQPYTVIDPERLAKFWGPAEAELRSQLPSIPWRFVQLHTIEDKYNHYSNIDRNSKLGVEFGLHEVLHGEFLDEVQRIYRTRDQATMQAQLLHLAIGMRNFLEHIAYLEVFEGFVILAEWIGEWLDNPLGPVPAMLWSRQCAGGLFFGVHMWENDILVFLADIQRNTESGGC
ncbi:hypothetical protein K505DRAFT_363465 [Melanomma pulvis-pyrius CBS 109.77]|uniref:2EXR domain-containing protein n=1 Tax=Melanomma pulvis-pyrius CBS 109.77 TaxID=1314802 RepID=A0A6A6X6A5_9PLEO|nr:hypothetical protein K505DRAFT_363465 [Melanomma pulvis-pyrius CBS 109.77]